MFAAIATFLLLATASLVFQDRPPRVLLDEAHHNVHTVDGSYQQFAKLLTANGFGVSPNKQPFSAEVLRECDVLIIANARAAGRSAPMEERAGPAFSSAEIEVLAEWVKAGGALLLVTDHWPIGPANSALAHRLGVKMSGGWTDDPEQTTDRAGHLLFTRKKGSLGDHAILSGRNDGEEVSEVRSFMGQSLVGPPGSVPLLRLSPTAVDLLPPEKRRVGAGGKSQAIAFEFGRGRVVVTGEAAMFRVQPDDRGGKPAFEGNRRFAINVVRWLSRHL